MAYCIDSYEIILCPECHAKVLYDDRDVKILLNPHMIFFIVKIKLVIVK